MATQSIPTPSHPPLILDTGLSDHSPAAPALQVIRRDGAFSPFDPAKIAQAMTKAFVAVEGPGAEASRRIHDTVAELTTQIVTTLRRRFGKERAVSIEDIQDQVELALMRSGEQKIARAYVLYREERAQQRRRLEQSTPAPTPRLNLSVRRPDGTTIPLDEVQLAAGIIRACRALDGVQPEAVMAEVRRNLYDGIQLHEIGQAQVMAARTLVEQEPNYAFVSARLLLNTLRDEALAFVLPTLSADVTIPYAEYFPEYIRKGISLDMLDRELRAFDLDRLASALRPERDDNFQFLGLQTLYDRLLPPPSQHAL